MTSALKVCATSKQLSRKEAEQQLLSFHPDFADIRQDPEFHDWVALQPALIQDALYKNNTDAKAAARAIDLYKVDTGKRKTTNKKSAAEAVGRTSSRAPAPTGKMRFSESQVAQMSAKNLRNLKKPSLDPCKTAASIAMNHVWRRQASPRTLVLTELGPPLIGLPQSPKLRS